MPSRFERYRVKDGVTQLGERFLNPVFQDLDLRLNGLEAQRTSWEEAVSTVFAFGLQRINELIGPSKESLDDAFAATEETRQAALAGLADLQLALLSVPDVPALSAVVDTLVDGLALAALSAEQPFLENTDDAANFTIPAGAVSGQLSAVAGFGVYRYDPASVEMADGETVLSPISGEGRWYLVAPHWDFVWAYLSGLLDDLQNEVEAASAAASKAQTTALPASKVLVGSSSLDFPSIAAGASSTLNIVVAGADTTDRVLLTPPSALPNGVIVVAYVSAADTVTVRLNNVTAAAIDPAAMTYLVTVIKP